MWDDAAISQSLSLPFSKTRHLCQIIAMRISGSKKSNQTQTNMQTVKLIKHRGRSTELALMPWPPTPSKPKSKTVNASRSQNHNHKDNPSQRANWSLSCSQWNNLFVLFLYLLPGSCPRTPNQFLFGAAPFKPNFAQVNS